MWRKPACFNSAILAVLSFLSLVHPALGAETGAYAPVDPAQLSWIQKPGAAVPLRTPLKDETGAPVTLGDFAGTAPIILDLGYFHCPSLCGVVRSDLFAALQQTGLQSRGQYNLVALSIDPAETPKDAASAKSADHAEFPDLNTGGFHYLTGSAGAVSAIEQAVGFRSQYDARFRQFLHPSGLVFLGRTGLVSSYLLGVGYRAGDLRAAVVRARSGGIARAALPILLLCFHFDASTGRYTLAIYKILRLAGLLTIATIIALIAVLSRRRPMNSDGHPLA